MELLRIGKVLQVATEAELALNESAFETLEKLVSEHSAEYPDGKEEVRAARSFPRQPIKCHSAGRNDAMKMWVMKQVLAPGVKNAEKPDLCAETILRVCGDLKQGFSARAEV